MQEIKLLKDYITLIQDDEIQEELYRLMQKTEIQQGFSLGSTYAGSNHPADENTSYGLLLHTLRVANVVAQLYRSYPEYNTLELDILLASAILHDVPYKFKENGYTNLRHAYDNAYWFMQNSELPIDKKYPIVGCILHHMGKWCPVETKDKETFPMNHLTWFLHLADNISSRKNIFINVDCMEYLKENLQQD